MFTRQLLRGLAVRGDLDEGSEALLLRSLAKTRPRSHAGWVFVFAEALGAHRLAAMHAASFAELCCAAIDLVDDVQDGDAARTLGESRLPVQVNVSSHMLVLGVLAAARLERTVRGPTSLVPDAYRLFSAMASGQRMELTREDWSPRRYEEVASLTCGKQLELYLRTATFAAATDVAPWLPLCEPLGIATQIACDLRSADPRLTMFPETEVTLMRSRWVDRARRSLDSLPVRGSSVLREMARFPLTPESC